MVNQWGHQMAKDMVILSVGELVGERHGDGVGTPDGERRGDLAGTTAGDCSSCLESDHFLKMMPANLESDSCHHFPTTPSSVFKIATFEICCASF